MVELRLRCLRLRSRSCSSSSSKVRCLARLGEEGRHQHSPETGEHLPYPDSHRLGEDNCLQATLWPAALGHCSADGRSRDVVSTNAHQISKTQDEEQSGKISHCNSVTLCDSLQFQLARRLELL